MPIKQSIFIIGEQRSGSNLLRLILNAHSKIFSPHPPHIIERIQPYIKNYGDLEKDENFDRLIHHVLLLIEKNPISWNTAISSEEVRVNCKTRSLFEVFRVVMGLCALEKGTKRWICKSNHNVYWQEDIEKYIPNSKFIYLYRDPRDVVLSFQKTPVGDKHPYIIAKKWAELQERCLKLEKKIGDRFFPISYENLITRPQETIANLSEFIGVKFEEHMLQYFTDEDAKVAAHKSQQWENVDKPILSSNYGKYEQLDREALVMIESVCHDMMSTLNYSSALGTDELRTYSEEEIVEFNTLNESLKEQFFANLDKSEKEVRQDLKQVIGLIKNEVRI